MRARRGQGHIRTLGGKTRYRLVYVDGKQRLEHRVVMEHVLKRRLRSNEIVHHRDQDGLNNVLNNLVLTMFGGHRRVYGGPRCWDLVMALRMRAKGATIRAVARRFGVSESSVNKGLKRRGFSTSTPRRLRFDRETLHRLYEEGFSQSEIARHLGVCSPSIRKALRKLGYAM